MDSPSREPSTSGCPGESTIYFGDTARVPYGPKSPETVRRYSLEILHWLLEQGVKAVVVACNTSTAHALRALQEATPVPVIGVIKPGAGRRSPRRSGGPVGVIGTAGTIASNAYARAIAALAPGLQVVQKRLSPVCTAGGGRLVRPPCDRAGRGGVSLSPPATKACERWFLVAPITRSYARCFSGSWVRRCS